MLDDARKIKPPAGWSISWIVELIDKAPGDPVAGWFTFGDLDDAIENFRSLRSDGCAARLVALLNAPVAGRNPAGH